MFWIDMLNKKIGGIAKVRDIKKKGIIRASIEEED